MVRRTAAAKAADVAAAAEHDAQVVAKVQSAVDDVADAQIARVEETRRATLHPIVQFPLVVVLSFATWAFGYAVLGQFSKGDLAVVTRTQDTWSEVAILVGWRVTELALGWFGGFDSLDAAMIDLLSHGPSVSYNWK